MAYDGGEQEYGETWADHDALEGLFADPPPPARERYELLGCAPEEEFRSAVARAHSDGPAHSGH